VGTLLSNSEARNSLLAAEPSQSVNSLANKASYIEIAKREALSNCSRIASILMLHKSYEEQMINKVTEVMNKKGKWKTGKKAELIVASCSIIVARTNHLPISLLDVADKLQMNVFELGKVFSEVVQLLNCNLPDIDPALFLEKCISLFMKHLYLNVKIDIEMTGPHSNSCKEVTKDLCEVSIRLINVAKDDWLVTGRRPTAITAASIVLAFLLIIQHSNDYKQSVYEEVKLLVHEELSKSDIKYLSELLNVSSNTTLLRVKELKTTLIRLGSKLLPWGNNLTLKNIIHHIPMILKHLELYSELNLKGNISEKTKEQTTNVHSDIKPPAFYKNQLKKEKRKAKIESAKKRIEGLRTTSLTPLESEPVDLDEEDLDIEKLLLQGISEEAILECKLKDNSLSLSFGTLSKSKQIDLDAEELNENDISDADISQFIKSPAEIQLLQNILHPNPP